METENTSSHPEIKKPDPISDEERLAGLNTEIM